ncbi:MAG: hypothetical protein SOW48_05695 [Peptoniphilaceae bacterium]|nr:hypothetical protein [Peptoniphilaceae bacterium]MDY3076123.1 hypothetical protein [Peptoniphilaceae bacterium]MDY3987064.1 hypothetical protein [Peptoniphilaceae bacterium]MDY6146148.1 hypothetical protein [Peptoniphilaceae bacterium]
MNKKKKPGQGLSLKVITEKVIFIFLTQIVTEIVGGNKMDILKVVSQGLVTALILYVFYQKDLSSLRTENQKMKKELKKIKKKLKGGE